MTTTSESISQSQPRRWSFARFALAFVVGVSVAIGLVAVGALAFDNQYAGRVLPGVRVGGVDLAGLDRATAIDRLREGFASVGTGRVVLAGPDGDVSLTYDELGRRPDLDAMVDEALAAGRPDGLDRLVVEVRTALRGTELEPRISLDEGVVDRGLATFAAGLDRPPVDARVTTTRTGFVIHPSTAGRRVDLSAADRAIKDALARLDAPAEVRFDIEALLVEPAVSDVAAGVATLRAEAMARDVVLADGKDTWTIDGDAVRSWITFAVTPDGRFEPTVAPGAVRAELKKLAPRFDRKPVSAEFMIGKNDQPVGVKPGVDGRALDVDGTVERIVAELGRRAGTPGGAPPNVAPALLITKPELSTEEAEKAAPLMAEISSWTTYYPIGEKNGFGANIEVPTAFIDGTVIAPGGVFDFWNVVGEVSRDRGYRQGGAIINGRTEPQGALAGGICSCSTTMFNAALRAGLDMGARRNHYYYIDRYPLGLDATVFISASGATQTMSWTNDTPYPILVRGTTWHVGSKGYVRFVLYSVPSGRRVVIAEPIVKNVRPATTITEDTSTLPTGRRQQVEYPTAGKDVWRTVTVYDAAGAILHQTTYYSHYAKVDGLILVGKPAVPAAAPSPSPDATPGGAGDTPPESPAP